MAGEWSTGRLADVAAGIQTGPFGSQLHASDYVPYGVPVVMPTNIRDRRIDTEGISFIGDDDADRLSRHKLRLHDLVFSRRGEVDKCALVTKDTVGWLCGTGCLLVRPDEKKCDPAFLSFHISAPDTREWLKQHAVGLVMPNLNTEILSSIPLNLPPLGEQRRIAVLLGSLDDKIELNRRMAATLEAMARALFKSWFVDFDPVRAKAEGRDPGLPAATAALFPDRFGEDGLPEGWQERPFGDVFEIRNGNTPSTEDTRYWGGDHDWATPKDLSPLKSPVLLATDRTLSDEGVAVVNSGLLPAGSVLMSTRAPIGYLALATRPVAINQGMAGIVRKEMSTAFAWLWCSANIDTFLAVAGGSTFPEISKGTLRKLPMVVPTADVSGAFAACVDPMVERLVELARESDRLAELRDTLLPKLISGELRIKDCASKGEAA